MHGSHAVEGARRGRDPWEEGVAARAARARRTGPGGEGGACGVAGRGSALLCERRGQLRPLCLQIRDMLEGCVAPWRARTRGCRLASWDACGRSCR